MSRCYEKGEGVQTSKLKATEYSSKARAQEDLWIKDHLGIYCRKNLNMIYAEEKPDCFPLTENQATGNEIKLPDAASLLSGNSKREMRVEKNAYLKAKKPYKGTDPYIFLSYSHQNMDEALDIIAFLQSLEYNIWYDEGIDPGTEWDKTIAEHVKSCEVF